MPLSHGVTDGPLDMLPCVGDGLKGGFKVTLIVQCIKDPEYVDADIRGFPHERVNDVIGVVLCSQQGSVRAAAS